MTAGLTDTFRERPRSGMVLLMVLLSFVLPKIPVLDLLALPITSFTTTIHEMGHAIACLLTGGHVAAMSIINDGEGHGGLTYCLGGLPFIYTQAGYISTALVGSLLIWLGRYPGLSRLVLRGIGVAFALGGSLFMLKTAFAGSVLAGLGSFLVAAAIGGALIWASLKLNFYWANLLLLFLGVQTGLNALNDDGTLLMQAFGSMPGTWSDATSMQNLTGIGAPVWAAWWTFLAVVMLGGTVYFSYKLDKKL